jgi:hypothetical protein
MSESPLLWVENQGHMVPAPVIQRFLESYLGSEAGRQPQLPSLGVHLQLLSSPSLRKYLKMGEEHTGVMARGSTRPRCRFCY